MTRNAPSGCRGADCRRLRALKRFKTSSPRGKKQDHLGYWLKPSSVRHHALSPRYYDPEPLAAVEALRATHDLRTIQELVDEGVLHFSTGDEVGKLAYGTGDIPFIRTSDISNWELKLDPKHGLSEQIYDQYSAKQDVQEGDIFVVRDGTYLIGECAFVSKYDTKIVYQSHLFKIRSSDHKRMSPYLLLALLSCRPVKAQIKAKRFTQDIIDSLGNRVMELVLPVPKDPAEQAKIAKMVKKSIDERIKARELAREARLRVVRLDGEQDR